MTKIRDNYSHIQIALHWLIVLLFVFNYIFDYHYTSLAPLLLSTSTQ